MAVARASACGVSTVMIIMLSEWYYKQMYIIVSQRIAKLHGGHVSVYSAGLGTGSTFTLHMPVFKTSSSIKRKRSQLSSSESSYSRIQLDNTLYMMEPRSGSPGNISLKRILVVDDASLNRKMISRIMKNICQEVLEAEDGQQAVDIVLNAVNMASTIDCVFMDYQMPRMDGPTAAVEMRKLGYAGPIIGVTGHAEQKWAELFLSGGANRVLIKPLTFEQIKAAIEGIRKPTSIIFSYYNLSLLCFHL